MLCNQRILKFYSTLCIGLWYNLISRRNWPGRAVVVRSINIALPFNYAVWKGPELSLCLWILSICVDKNLFHCRKFYVFWFIHQLKDTLWQNNYVTALVFMSQLQSLMFKIWIHMLNYKLTRSSYSIKHQTVTWLLIKLWMTIFGTWWTKSLIPSVWPWSTPSLSRHSSSSLRSLWTSDINRACCSYLKPILWLKGLWIANWSHS